MRERYRTNQKALNFDSNPRNLDLSSGFPPRQPLFQYNERTILFMRASDFG